MQKSFDPELPLTLYIHFPWCVKKCPYCDFNSHALKEPLPEEAYVNALLLNLEMHLPLIHQRPIISIFMGGGTPSLFSAKAIENLLNGIRARCLLKEEAEITLEANPGTVESERFAGYKEIGINRISLGVQSFQDAFLSALGRIHHGDDAIAAVTTLKAAGFTNFNLDLMFGLPKQSIAEALSDLKQAIALSPTHLSWYELTLEPNTYFWHHPPKLPEEDTMANIQEEGLCLLSEAGFIQYEVSAYSRNKPCLHNLNYWKFGDYLGIGAGSHAKITDIHNGKITRLHHFRHPKQYMEATNGFIKESQLIEHDQLAFEFMLNGLRLKQGIPSVFFTQRTGLPIANIGSQLAFAEQKGWLYPLGENICATPKGYRFLNDLIGLFLVENANNSSI